MIKAEYKQKLLDYIDKKDMDAFGQIYLERLNKVNNNDLYYCSYMCCII